MFLQIHTVQNPIGELRCNIPPGTYVDGKVPGLEYVPVPDDVSPPSPSPGCMRLVADMSGENIVPDPVVTNSTGKFEGWVDGETIHWELTLTDIDQFVFSHIHLGNASSPVPLAVPLWGPIWLTPGLNSSGEAQALNDVLMSGWSTNVTAETTTTGEITGAALAAVPRLNPSFNGTKTFTGTVSSDEFAGPLAYFKMKQFLSYAEDSLASANAHTNSNLDAGLLRGQLRMENSCSPPPPPPTPSSSAYHNLSWGLLALASGAFTCILVLA